MTNIKVQFYIRKLLIRLSFIRNFIFIGQINIDDLEKQIQQDTKQLEYLNKTEDIKQICKVKFRLEVLKRELTGEYLDEDKVVWKDDDEKEGDEKEEDEEEGDEEEEENLD